MNQSGAPEIKISLYAMPDLYRSRMKTDDVEDKVNRIIRFIADKKGIRMPDLLGKSRKSEFVYCRHLCIYIIRHRTSFTHSEIGRKFNMSDHTTSMHAIQSIKNYMATDPDRRAEVEKFLSVLY